MNVSETSVETAYLRSLQSLPKGFCLSFVVSHYSSPPYLLSHSLHAPLKETRVKDRSMEERLGVLVSLPASTFGSCCSCPLPNPHLSLSSQITSLSPPYRSLRFTPSFGGGMDYEGERKGNSRLLPSCLSTLFPHHVTHRSLPFPTLLFRSVRYASVSFPTVFHLQH